MYATSTEISAELVFMDNVLQYMGRSFEKKKKPRIEKGGAIYWSKSGLITYRLVQTVCQTLLYGFASCDKLLKFSEWTSIWKVNRLYVKIKRQRTSNFKFIVVIIIIIKSNITSAKRWLLVKVCWNKLTTCNDGDKFNPLRVTKKRGVVKKKQGDREGREGEARDRNREREKDQWSDGERNKRGKLNKRIMFFNNITFMTISTSKSSLSKISWSKTSVKIRSTC